MCFKTPVLHSVLYTARLASFVNSWTLLKPSQTPPWPQLKTATYDRDASRPGIHFIACTLVTCGTSATEKTKRMTLCSSGIRAGRFAGIGSAGAPRLPRAPRPPEADTDVWPFCRGCRPLMSCADGSPPLRFGPRYVTTPIAPRVCTYSTVVVTGATSSTGSPHVFTQIPRTICYHRTRGPPLQQNYIILESMFFMIHKIFNPSNAKAIEFALQI
jgi:hypothetical protein